MVKVDRNRQELRRKDPAHSRLALILIDNILELRIHKLCEHEFAQDRMWKGLDPFKYAESEKKEVLGQHFDKKVNFLRKINGLSEQEADFLLICHRYRNELYHRGILKEDIIAHVSNEYYSFACDFYKRNRPRSYGSNGPGISLAEKSLLALIKKSRGFSPFDNDWESLWDALKSKKFMLDISFSHALSGHLLERLQTVDELIHYVKNGGNQTFETPDDYLKHMQVWRFFWTDEGKKFIGSNMPAGKRSVQDCISFLQEHWDADYKYRDIARWEKRVVGLKQEKSKFVLLKKFDKVLQEFEPFEEIIFEETEAFDNWVNEQIDIMRGK